LAEEAIHNHTKKWLSIIKKIPLEMTLHVYILRSHYWQVKKKKETDFVQAKMATVAENSVIKVASLSGSLRKASLRFSFIHMNVRNISFGIVETMHLYFLLVRIIYALKNENFSRCTLTWKLYREAGTFPRNNLLTWKCR
jgi:hypothetical protein